MSVLATDIPNLLNGVSQQADSLRFPSQAKEQINQYPSIAYGNGKRPPTRHLSRLYLVGDLQNEEDGTPKEFVHEILRDKDENHFFVVRGQQEPKLDVWGIDGSPQTTITDSVTDDYLATDTPNTSLKAVTVADYTLIVNKDIKPAMLPELTEERPPEALVFCKTLKRTDRFEIRLFNNPSNNVPDYVASIIDIENIPGAASPSGGPYSPTQWHVMALLIGQLANQGAESLYYMPQVGGIGYFKKHDNSDFRIEVWSSEPEALVVVKDKVDSLSTLPKKAWNGFKIQIQPAADDPDSESYYVQFKAQDENSITISDGSWEESRAGGIQYKLDPATMPHALVSLGGGQFEFKELEWGELVVGDEDSNAVPSFVGRTIEDIFFYKNRLSILSGENVSMSENGSYFNFFRTSVLDLLDSDRIDVTNNHKNISFFKYTAQINDSLILFDARSQYRLSGGDLLTPSTVSIEHVHNAEFQEDSEPISLGSTILFPFQRGNYSGFYEMNQISEAPEFKANEISEHVPQYIEGRVMKAIASKAESLLFCQTPDYPGLYCFKWYDQGGERLQAAWFKFDFNGDKVRHFFIVDSWLYLVIKRRDGIFLERMLLTPNVNEGGLQHPLYLDRLITEDDIVDRTYDPVKNETTIVLPYWPLEGTLEVVETGSDKPGIPALAEGENIVLYFEDNETPIMFQLGYSEPSGLTIPQSESLDNIVVLKGNHLDTPLRIGVAYEGRYTLSPSVFRQQERTISVDRNQLRYGKIIVDRSIEFQIQVEVEGSETTVDLFDSHILGAEASVVGAQQVPVSGNWKFPIFSRADFVTITLINSSPYPANYISMEFDQSVSDKRRRVR